MKAIYTATGLAIWKIGSWVGIPYAKRKLESRA
jgi:hypothetical protein